MAEEGQKAKDYRRIRRCQALAQSVSITACAIPQFYNPSFLEKIGLMLDTIPSEGVRDWSSKGEDKVSHNTH